MDYSADLGAKPPVREQTIRDILDPPSSADFNSHFVVFIQDSVSITLRVSVYGWTFPPWFTLSLDPLWVLIRTVVRGGEM